MYDKIGIWALVAGWVLIAPCLAQSDPNVAKENAQLRQRVDTLEKQVQQLQTTVKPPAAQQSPVPSPPPAAEQTPVPTPPAEPAKLEPPKKPLWSTLDIQLYGYVKLDAAWDSSGVFPGDYVLYTREGREHDEEFNLTAKQTRLGVKIAGPDAGDMKTSGVIEFDFYGSAGAENKANVLLRHAYMVFDWPDSQFSVLAGQTVDVISPLYPNTLNYTVLWDAGNIGYRHPQVRLTKQFRVGDDMTLELAGAISRTIGDVETLNFTPGANAGFPTFQARAGLTFPWFGFKPTTIGVSGHWGREKYSSSEKIDSWSLNLDVLQPICPVVTVKGEAYVGENLDDYFGGIGQGVRTRTVGPTTLFEKAIGDRGGWFAVTLTPWAAWSFNLGAGIDDVERGDVTAGTATDRTLNRSIFANAIYALNKSADIGVELSQWHTDFKGTDDVDDVRIQTAFIYKF